MNTCKCCKHWTNPFAFEDTPLDGLSGYCRYPAVGIQRPHMGLETPQLQDTGHDSLVLWLEYPARPIYISTMCNFGCVHWEPKQTSQH